MALQYSGTLRDNQLAQIETTVGTTGTLIIFGGTMPGNCAAADTTPVLATIALPSDWLQATSSGVIAKTAGAWTDSSADATGTATHFRIKAGATCHVQGSVGTSNSDMIVDNTSFNSGQSFSVTTFQISAGNA